MSHTYLTSLILLSSAAFCAAVPSADLSNIESSLLRRAVVVPTNESTNGIPKSVSIVDLSQPLDFNFGFSRVDKNFTIPQSITKEVAAAITIGCKNCTTTGTATVTNTGIQFNARNLQRWQQSSQPGNALPDIFSGGSIQLTVRNFSAHIELETKLSGKMSIPVLQFPDFSIPGLGWTVRIRIPTLIEVQSS